MEAGALLSIFDDRQGFIYEYYSPEDIDVEIIKHIIFRATLFLVGGAEDVKSDRESLLDLPEHDLFGIVSMTSAPCPSIRGGNMPIILIYFAPTSQKGLVYMKIASVMNLLKDAVLSIKGYWDKKGFSNKKEVYRIVREFPGLVGNFVSESLGPTADLLENIEIFDVKCPECGVPTRVKVPKNIKSFFSIPVINIPCKHEFEVYFTPGPQLRGTSQVLKKSDNEGDLKDIFEKL